MGITVLPAPNFPSVGESLARLGPDLGRILYPNREDNRQKADRMQQLQEAFITNPGAISRTAAFSRQNEGFSAQLGELVGEDFAQMIRNTPEDLDEALSVSAMEQAVALRRDDPKAFRNLAAEAAGIGVAVEDLITVEKRKRFLELWNRLRTGEITDAEITGSDRGLFTEFGAEIIEPKAPGRNILGENIAGDNQALLSKHGLDNFTTEQHRQFAIDRVNPAYSRALAIANQREAEVVEPEDEITRQTAVVTARDIERDLRSIDVSVPFSDILDYVESPDPGSTVGRGLSVFNERSRGEATRRIERQRAVDLGIAGTRIRSVINATRGRNPISQDQAKSQILDQINTSINPMLKQMGDDLGIPGLHAEIPDIKKFLKIPFTDIEIDFLRSDADIPGITVLDGAGNEFDFNQIMNLGTIPREGGTLSERASQQLTQLNAVPTERRRAAEASIKASSPGIYAELVRLGHITP